MKRYIQSSKDDDRLSKIFKQVDDRLDLDDIGTTWDYDDLNIYLTVVNEYSEISEYKIPLKDVLDPELSIDDAAEYILDNVEY